MSGFFGKGPLFYTVLTLASIKTWLQAQALTLTSTLTINKTAQASTAETLLEASVTDDSVGKFRLQNATTTNNNFIARLLGIGAATNQALQVMGQASNDTGTTPVVVFIGQTVGGAALSNRPIAAWDNLTTRGMTLWPAGLIIGSGTSTAAAAKLEVQDTKSQVMFGNAADQGGLFGDNAAARITYGVKYTGSAWEARQTTGAVIQVGLGSILFYTAAGVVGAAPTFTEQARLTTTGLGVGGTPACKVDVAGSIRTTGEGEPSSGAGGTFRYSTGTATTLISSYDFTGAAWKDIKVRGQNVYITTNGSDRVVVTTSAVANFLPVTFATYTLATLPTASGVTRGQVWCSDHTGGARFVYSDGTNWRDVRTGNVAA